MIFATHPLIIIEGLVNCHNDLIGLCLAIIGIYFLLKNKNLPGRIILILSAGIKYMTFPLVFLIKHDKKKINNLVFVAVIAIIIYLAIFNEVQPWYFLTLFAFLPYFEKLISRLDIFFVGLLLSYYPYIRLGGWDSLEKLSLKHIIILGFFIINIMYFIGLSFKHEKNN